MCLEEVKTFLGSKGLTFPELEQPEWLEKLHFLGDMTGHLNMLNAALQGKGRTPLHMSEEVLAFEHKRFTERYTVTLPQFERVQRSSHDEFGVFTFLQSSQCKHHLGNDSVSSERKIHIILPCHSPKPRSSLLNMTASPGVSPPDLEMELAEHQCRV